MKNFSREEIDSLYEWLTWNRGADLPLIDIKALCDMAKKYLSCKENFIQLEENYNNLLREYDELFNEANKIRKQRDYCWYPYFLGKRGEVTVTTTEDGECVAVTRQDEEGRILKVIWEKNNDRD